VAAGMAWVICDFFNFSPGEPTFAKASAVNEGYNFGILPFFDKYHFLNVAKCAMGLFYVISYKV